MDKEVKKLYISLLQDKKGRKMIDALPFAYGYIGIIYDDGRCAAIEPFLNQDGYTIPFLPQKTLTDERTDFERHFKLESELRWTKE